MELSIQEVGPTEAIVLALLDFLVDPLLPSKCLSKDQHPSQEELVAKQVHAVVLLYNYYHRKQDPGLEFLEFISFCKLAMVLKPSLLSYLSFMQRSDYGGLELDSLDNHMSLTEKEIVNACEVSRSLDASNDKPFIEGWPVSKVAVFLVDSTWEGCFLFHSSITQGVWSVIEKEVTLPGEEVANKKKRVIKKTPKENQTMEEAGLQQAAYLAVKEAWAFNQGELKILEAYTVYSTSKPKTAVRLYIMLCKNSKQDESLVPISDALASLQGPLVRKESSSWLLTPVVEYFHLLPFADKVSDWLSRSKEMKENGTLLAEPTEDAHCLGSHLNFEESPNPSQNFEEVKDLDNSNNSLTEKLVVNSLGSLRVGNEVKNSNNHQSKEEVVSSSSNHREPAKDAQNGGTSNLKRKDFPFISDYSHMPKGVEENCSSQRKDVLMYRKRNRSQKNNATKENVSQEKECPVSGSSNSINVQDQKQIIIAQEPDQSALNRGAIVVAENLETTSQKHNEDKVYFDQDEKLDRTIVSFDSDSEYRQKLQLKFASKKNLLSQTALKVLYRKIELASQRIRLNQDEIALCERKIDLIIKGGEDNIDLQINSVIEGCNELFLRSSATETKKGPHSEEPDLPPPSKRKRLSEANLSSHDSCGKLDSICYDNKWTLPAYIISTSEGGYKSSVTVKGGDFDCSSEGNLSPTPQGARNSAALFMWAELQKMQWECNSQREISPGSAMLA